MAQMRDMRLYYCYRCSEWYKVLYGNYVTALLRYGEFTCIECGEFVGGWKSTEKTHAQPSI